MIMLAMLAAACSGAAKSAIDASIDSAAPDAAPDAQVAAVCEWGGAPGTCITATACAAIATDTAKTGACVTGLSCCIVTPDVANNPPVPVGYQLMMQADVTAAMTTWAVEILDDPMTYPMFATTTQTFGTLMVLARVEWHPPDFQNSVIHRGVTLYEPI